MLKLITRQTSGWELPSRTRRTLGSEALISQAWQGLRSSSFRSLKVRHLFWTSCLISLYDQWREISKVMIHSSYLSLPGIILSASPCKLFSLICECIFGSFCCKTLPALLLQAWKKPKTATNEEVKNLYKNFTLLQENVSLRGRNGAVPAGWCAWHQMVPT